MKPRRSTAVLIATWIAMFVLYMFVRPEHPVSTGQHATNAVSTVVNTTAPASNPSPGGH